VRVLIATRHPVTRRFIEAAVSAALGSTPRVHGCSRADLVTKLLLSGIDLVIVEHSLSLDDGAELVYQLRSQGSAAAIYLLGWTPPSWYESGVDLRFVSFAEGWEQLRRCLERDFGGRVRVSSLAVWSW
jgi:hypothetical protein